MGEISDVLNNLNQAVKDNTPPQEVQKILTSLNKELSVEGSNKKANVEVLLTKGIIETFCIIFKSKEVHSPSTFALVAEILAEVAKLGVLRIIEFVDYTVTDLGDSTVVDTGSFLLGENDSGRKHCSDKDVIVPLLDLLNNDDSNVVLQVCRALGNICYDNDLARSLVKQHNGVEHLIQLLKSLLVKDNLPENMRTITSGCLLNLTDTYEEIQEQAVDAGILDVLLQYLLKFSTDEDVVTHCLLVLSCLADSSNGRAKILEKSVLSNLLSLLEKPLNDDIMDSLLELFGNLCENDSAKLSLAQMGLCEKLVEIVEKHLNSESQVNGAFNICKTIPDLIILILTGDASMEHLWSDGCGVVYQKTLKWLKSTDENLLIAGALAAGNFARKDSHCIQMLKDGVVQELKQLLEKHSGREGDIRMQHAVLSALRNLAIPTQNKAAMVELDVVETLIDMMNVETFPVVFKLLGTLRMLLDKQESVAIQVGENIEFVERLVKWCNVDDHPGVKGEATRLLAWLAKNSKSSSVMRNLLETNALPPIISMLKSEHDVMKNEALVAVSLVASCCLSDFEAVAISTNLVGLLHQLSKSSLSSELLENVLALLIILSDSAKLKACVLDARMCTDLEKVRKDHKEERTRELISRTLKVFEKSP